MIDSEEPRHRRILVGTHETARQVHDIGDGLRRAGHQVTTVVGRRNPLYPDLPYDQVVDEQPRDVLKRVPGVGRALDLAHRGRLAATRRPVPRWIRDHDVFIFVWGGSLLPANVDLSLLRRLDKTVLCLFLGTDIRHWSAAEQYRAEIGLGTYEGYRSLRSLDRAVRTLRMAELYAHARFLQPSYAELALAPYMHCFLAVDLSLYKFAVPARRAPVVIHAPSRRTVKGTVEILAAVERLHDEGVEFEFRLLEHLPNSKVLRHLIDADVVVDQLNESNYGMLGLEAMASGCAVLGGNRPDVVPIPPDRPVVHITPSTVLDQLRVLVTDPIRRTRLAEHGRAFVERHHDHVRVASDMLLTPARAARNDHDYTPRWFADRYVLPPELILSRANRVLTARVARRVGLDVADLRRRHLA